MSKIRNTIGRTFNSPVLNNDDVPEKFRQTFTLSSGKKALFTRITIAAAEVEAQTYVVQEINGRDQSALTPESLRDITRTMVLQQFFPAIGVRKEDKIEILDGSRRRASALLCNCGLDILVTDHPVTAAEARKLAKDIQTAREHNIREVGMRLQALKNSGLSQKEIAETENLSQATVTRALQAASVSSDLLVVFPVQSVLSYADYKSLLLTEEILKNKDVEVSDLIVSLSDVIANIVDDTTLADDEVKNKILTELKKEAQVMGQIASKDKPVATSLWQFDDKNRFARKKTKGRAFSYEFNRLSPELQEELDKTIASILKTHLA